MAAAKKATQSVEELVHTTLKAIALADGPQKLGPKGVPIGSGPASSLAKAQIFHADRPLAVAVGPGKSEGVELTAAGFEAVARELPDDRVGAAAKRVALKLPIGERIDFLTAVVNRTPLAAPDLVPLLEAATAEERLEREARLVAAARRKEREDQALAALERFRTGLEDRRKARVAFLQKELEIEGAVAQTVDTSAPSVGLPLPQTPENRDFRC